jgi:hypothetical protein
MKYITEPIGGFRWAVVDTETRETVEWYKSAFTAYQRTDALNAWVQREEYADLARLMGEDWVDMFVRLFLGDDKADEFRVDYRATLAEAR